jgi:hypothetical protein
MSKKTVREGREREGEQQTKPPCLIEGPAGHACALHGIARWQPSAAELASPCAHLDPGRVFSLPLFSTGN